MSLRNAKRLLLAPLLAASLIGPAAAQSVGTCDLPAASIANLYGPVAETVREFAGGQIRVIALDEGPDARGSGMFNRGAYHIAVNTRLDDATPTTCALVSAQGSEGFFGLYLADLSEEAGPDGATIITLPVDRVLGGDMIFRHTLYLSVDSATGAVGARYEAPAAPPSGNTK